MAFQIDLVEFFKTPALSALIGASTALVCIPLTQWLNRKATHSQWLREKRASAYADLLTALDHALDADMQAEDDRAYADTAAYKTISADFFRARSTVQLFGHRSLITLLDDAEARARGATGFGQSAQTLIEIRPQILNVARKEFRSDI